MKRGIATFTLDYGKCPPWLFEKMVSLSREMIYVLVKEFGPDEFVARMGDPVWFQALGTVLAFDWNASGLTTILTAALKEAIRYQENDLGIYICGGKGKTSRKTPDQIIELGTRASFSESRIKSLVHSSKMSAKVDSALVQDGFELYHHTFFFSKNGAWTVVQQGMNKRKKSARRYHWHSEKVSDFVCEPHSGIASQVRGAEFLNMVAAESSGNRDMSVEVLRQGVSGMLRDLKVIDRFENDLSRMVRLEKEDSGDQLSLLELAPVEFHEHPVMYENFSRSKYLHKILDLLCEKRPGSYKELIAEKGVGPKTIRALSLVSEVIYGAKASYRDPARYSFAHGGKDATPYPVDRETYKDTIKILKEAANKMKISPPDKNRFLKNL